MINAYVHEVEADGRRYFSVVGMFTILTLTQGEAEDTVRRIKGFYQREVRRE
jgi:hypothetical protein